MKSLLVTFAMIFGLSFGLSGCSYFGKHKHHGSCACEKNGKECKCGGGDCKEGSCDMKNEPAKNEPAKTEPAKVEEKKVEAAPAAAPAKKSKKSKKSKKADAPAAETKN